MKQRSCLAPLLPQIRQLAESGMDTKQIRRTLNLPVEAEQVRRFCHRHGLPVRHPGADPGDKNPAWNGGRIVHRGRVRAYRPDHPAAHNNHVWEHRLVMEAAIGRYLTRSEVVHHVNGDGTDNRIENLRLYSNNRDHLADTLKGQCPKWTEEGRRLILEGVQRGILTRRRQAAARRVQQETDGPS
jgi:hypothetical protein